MAPSRRQIGMSRDLCCAMPAHAVDYGCLLLGNQRLPGALGGFVEFAALVILTMLQACLSFLWPGSRGRWWLAAVAALWEAPAVACRAVSIADTQAEASRHRSIACFC